MLLIVAMFFNEWNKSRNGNILLAIKQFNYCIDCFFLYFP